MYNTLLQVYLQNEHTFSPSEFLEEMQKAGVPPNQVGNCIHHSLLTSTHFHTFATLLLFNIPVPSLSSPQGTLSLLLQAYCLQGNIAGSTAILEHMKAKQFPINEHTYASLITGYARSGDMAAAEQLLDDMRRRQIKPGLVSYVALLCAHSDAGDMEAIHKVQSNSVRVHAFSDSI